ncbi:hypothetical protein CLAFUW4_06574 [Fulvia fulva]|uniref:uncharacterized protein n=1 Tax=Passalora fulva TaxID=5499 RepID=UPI002852C01D|nr:uncharacterized protein CLAFUR5_20220 [Fulvia fulva]KAK4621369.1 hypothetical protein CLAFUR4_06582 [Fulvia fulva]WMI38917.1 hypothetical protein CLAFUR5_20220 [Fulvia fulva]WPV16502.1 hypothetical protein CLAFUW4_06574 [Fulvia fulva]WPV31258.1 hypothetical protein CLAFUW7_06573 [Fulvia fulva]
MKNVSNATGRPARVSEAGPILEQAKRLLYLSGDEDQRAPRDLRPMITAINGSSQPRRTAQEPVADLRRRYSQAIGDANSLAREEDIKRADRIYEDGEDGEDGVGWSGDEEDDHDNYEDHNADGSSVDNISSISGSPSSSTRSKTIRQSTMQRFRNPSSASGLPSPRATSRSADEIYDNITVSPTPRRVKGAGSSAQHARRSPSPAKRKRSTSSMSPKSSTGAQKTRTVAKKPRYSEKASFSDSPLQQHRKDSVMHIGEESTQHEDTLDPDHKRGLNLEQTPLLSQGNVEVKPDHTETAPASEHNLAQDSGQGCTVQTESREQVSSSAPREQSQDVSVTCMTDTTAPGGNARKIAILLLDLDENRVKKQHSMASFDMTDVKIRRQLTLLGHKFD